MPSMRHTRRGSVPICAHLYIIAQRLASRNVRGVVARWLVHGLVHGAPASRARAAHETRVCASRRFSAPWRTASLLFDEPRCARHCGSAHCDGSTIHRPHSTPPRPRSPARRCLAVERSHRDRFANAGELLRGVHYRNSRDGLLCNDWPTHILVHDHAHSTPHAPPRTHEGAVSPMAQARAASGIHTMCTTVPPGAHLHMMCQRVASPLVRGTKARWPHRRVVGGTWFD